MLYDQLVINNLKKMKKRKLPKYQVGTTDKGLAALKAASMAISGATLPSSAATASMAGANAIDTTVDENIQELSPGLCVNSMGQRVDCVTKELINATDTNPQMQGFTMDGDGVYRKKEITDKPGSPLGYSEEFKGINAILDMTKAIAGTVNDFKTSRRERQDYIEAIQPDTRYNQYEKGLNNVPVYMQKGGQTKDDREMLSGVADILRRVKSSSNRKEIAKYMMDGFREEGVVFKPSDFLKSANAYSGEKELLEMKKGGEMIRRADGSYSKRGLWDNIRANKGSGKKPTKAMLEQERKLKAKMRTGGGMVNCANCGHSWKYDDGGENPMSCHKCGGKVKYEKGGIYIDPSKKGTFTAAATKNNMSVQEFANKVLSSPEGKYSPIMRKKANFAKNAAGWKKQEGGLINETGYLPGTPTENNPYNIIPSDTITMQGVPKNIMAYPNNGRPMLMLANSGEYNFPGSDYVLEVPAMDEESFYQEDMSEMKTGGIPDRYKNKGFTRVGAKRKSTRPGKKWMVLAKKGDKYKIVHGGYVGMKDYTQHRNKKRQKNFWNRMGGKNSSKAKDPFSPLYWHKRFGTWQEGGQVTMDQQQLSQEELIQILQIFAEDNNITIEELMAELQKLPEDQMQKAIQDIIEDVQETMMEEDGEETDDNDEEENDEAEVEVEEMQTGGITQMDGVPRYMANAELEKGEVFQDQQGMIKKVAENEPIHEDGGSPQANVSRVLEDTSDKRKDIDSRLLLINPDQAFRLTGFKPKKSVSHSKLYEQANESYTKKLNTFEKKIKDNMDFIRYKNGGIFAENALNENIKMLEAMPKPIDIFDTIYAHQEEVKQRYNITNSTNQAKTGGRKLPMYQTGTIGYIKAKAKKVDKQPAGSKQVGEDAQNIYYGIPGTDSYSTVPKTSYGKKTTKTDEEYIAGLTNYSWDDLVKNKIVADTPANKNIYDKYSSEYDYSYVPKPRSMTVVAPPIVTDSPSKTPVTGIPPRKYDFSKKAEPSKFNEPLRWYDTMPSTLNYLSSLGRTPVDLEQLQYEPINAREESWLPQIMQTEGDFQTALRSIPMDGGTGQANIANLLAQKYSADQQAIAGVESRNRAKEDQMNAINAQGRMQMNATNLGLRDTFNNRVLQGKEVQRISKLNAFNDYATMVAQNAKLNREGNLLMQLTPYFDQFAQFNGNTYTPSQFTKDVNSGRYKVESVRLSNGQLQEFIVDQTTGKRVPKSK